MAQNPLTDLLDAQQAVRDAQAELERAVAARDVALVEAARVHPVTDLAVELGISRQMTTRILHRARS